MKTEREFIDSVFVKYEDQMTSRQRRIRLYRTVSLCAAAACICFVTFVGIRVLPYINASNESLAHDAANGDMYYLYSAKTTNDEGIAITVPESAADLTASYSAKNDILADAPEKTLMAAMDAEDALEETEAADYKMFAFNMRTPETSKLISNSVNYTVSLEEDITCDIYYTDFPEMDIINNSIAEENNEVVYGNCTVGGENKYYINIKNNTALVLIDEKAYTEDEILLIANSIEY